MNKLTVRTDQLVDLIRILLTASNRIKDINTTSHLSTILDHQIIPATTSQPCIPRPKWLPIKQAHTSIRSRNHIRNLLHPSRLSLGTLWNPRRITRERVSRIITDDRPIRLCDHDLFSERLTHLLEAVTKITECCLGVVERIVRDAHDIKVRRKERTCAEDGLEPPFLRVPFPAVVQMDHDLGLGRESRVFDAKCG